MGSKAQKTAAGAAALAFLIAVIPPEAVGGDLIPANKAQVERWFRANVGHWSGRRGTLEPALVAAESAAARVIRVGKGGEFGKIADAIRSVPSGNRRRVVIRVGGGTYREKVRIGADKPFVTLLGQAGSSPVLVAESTAAHGGTIGSATLTVESDYFVMVNMIVKNAAPKPSGKSGEQAVAMRLWGSRAAIYGCGFYGFQDTVCDERGKHFYKDNHIEGTVDFIFGNAKSLFLRNEIVVVESGGYAFIAAQGRTAAEDTGFAFVHCTVGGRVTGAMLGRAWAPRSRVVYARTRMSGAVSPRGWSDNFRPDRNGGVFFGEYKNTGPGADGTKRVNFSKSLNDEQAKPFLSLTFIDGAKWLLPPPSTI